MAKKIITGFGKPDFITFTNVFAHIENLHQLLDCLKLLMAPHTVLVIENHYLGAVLDGNQFDTFYHEHPRTYSYTSFVHVARTLKVDLLKVEFPSRYGGNIRVYLGNCPGLRGDFDAGLLRDRERQFLENFKALQRGVKSWRDAKFASIQGLVQRHGKLRAKAFPGRAAILVKLLGLNENLISAVYEKPGSMKIGHYLPGTRIPIYSDEELFALPDSGQPLLNLAWHISKEIHGYLKDHGHRGEVVDILSPDDFRHT